MGHEKIIAIVGNPNCGKSTLFNMLTGGCERVGNWPGVTVERCEGTYPYAGKKVQVVDLPGIYSLSTGSLDEQVARDFILQTRPDLIVNIVDASTLERNFYLTLQLLEMRVPVVVVLNMMDIVRQKGISLNVSELEKVLDCPVVCAVARRGQGVDELKAAVARALTQPRVSQINVYYPDEVEREIEQMIRRLAEKPIGGAAERRWLATKLLERDLRPQRVGNDTDILTESDAARRRIESVLGESTEMIVADSRYGFIRSICKKVLDTRNLTRWSLTDAIDKVALSRLFGIPLFFVAMYMTFWFTINFAGCFIDFFSLSGEAIFVDGVGRLLSAAGVPVWITHILADGIGGGIQTILSFIPPIFCMFLALSVLEDSGYMARAAFLMDRLMRTIGLPGKAFVPLLIGFGCNVPAIMAARTLENPRDRVLTIMMNPFMSCGARMPVYAVFSAVFFPRTGGAIIFLLYLIGVLLAVGTAFLLKNTVLPGEPAEFIMELPPYHVPTMKTMFVHTVTRLNAFLWRAGKVILPAIVVLGFFHSLGTDGSFGNQGSERSVLSQAGKLLVPVFRPLGVQDDNWPAAVGIVTGVFAKEMVIGTLESLYSQLDQSDTAPVADTLPARPVLESLYAAVRTIPENLRQLPVPFWSSTAPVAVEAADRRTANNMLRYFDGKAGAFAYLLLVLLYMPCVGAMAAVYRELNWWWMLFGVGYMSGVAWVAATLFYQVVRFPAHPVSSFGWIIFCLGLCGGWVLWLRRVGLNGRIAFTARQE